MRCGEANFPLLPVIDRGKSASMKIPATVSYFNENQKLFRLGHNQVDFSQLTEIIPLDKLKPLISQELAGHLLMLVSC